MPLLSHNKQKSKIQLQSTTHLQICLEFIERPVPSLSRDEDRRRAIAKRVVVEPMVVPAPPRAIAVKV